MSDCLNTNKCIKGTVPFSDQIDDTRELQNKITELNDQFRLEILSEDANEEIKKSILMPIYKYTFEDYVNGMQESMFGLLNDAMNKPIKIETFTKDQRIFFLGILILLIFLIIYIVKLINGKKN